MQLTQFTDLGLRVLMYLSKKAPDQVVTINEISAAFGVSRHNLVKVVHFLSQKDYLITVRGKGGGLDLAKNPVDYPLGSIIRLLEQGFELVSCTSPPCPLKQSCELKNILKQALNAFFEVLDRYTLADLVRNQTEVSLTELHLLMRQIKST
ncbi:MAG: Rrf2 family transcriptional regulator [Neisseriaceae bacterium]|nr:Rrf2 family transcriptional regulator [Neisseriaceae bacterium]